MERKVVVITGASGGIGAALARLLGTEGHQVVLAARRENELKKAAKHAGSGAVPVVADVTRRADVQRLKDTALDTFGRVDVWINNAGRGITRPVLELTDDDVDQIMAVNLKSALYGMQEIVPYFQQKGKGHLINVSSFLGRVPLVTSRSIYSAAKAALNVLTANVRMDLREQYPNVHVSLVMPGMVLTDFGKNALGSAPQTRPAGAGNPMNAQTADKVSVAIAALIEHPQSEIYTNPASAEIARRYREDVDLFERNLRRRE
jgi:NAD(P)-dependent dehydrogenase (short-subunit alcohol dehydrogenase family)